VPAAMTSKKADPADAMVKPTSIPMLLGPNDADRSVRNNGPTVQAPNVAPPPAIPVPTVPAPNVLPSVTSNGVPMTPPPLPPAAPPAPRLE
jgi:hypothetical protein